MATKINLKSGESYVAPAIKPYAPPKPTAPTIKPKTSDVAPWQSVQTAFNISQPGIGGQVAKSLPETERTQIATGTEQWMQNAPFQAGFLQGVSLNDPLQTLEKKIGQDIAEPESGRYTAGKVVGTMAQFAVPYTGASGAIGKVTKALFPKLGTLGSNVVKSIATDIAVGLPLNINYAFGKEDLTGADALKNIALNTGIDLIAGGVLEGLGYALKLKSGKSVATKQDFENLTPKEKEEVLLMLPAPKTESAMIEPGKVIAGGRILDQTFNPITKESFIGQLAERIGKIEPGMWNRFNKAKMDQAKALEESIEQIEKMSDVEWIQFARENNLGVFGVDFATKSVPKPVGGEPLKFATQVPPQQAIIPTQPVSAEVGTTIPQAQQTPQIEEFTIPIAEKESLADRLAANQTLGFAPEELKAFDLTDVGQKAKSLGYDIAEAFLNKQEFLESNVAKKQASLGEVLTQKELVQTVRNAGGKVDFMLDDGFVTKSGEVIPELSYVNVYNNTFKKLGKELNDYMLHKHNMSRMSLKENALREVQDFEIRRPELAGLDDDVLKELAKTSEEANILVSEYQDLIKNYTNTKNKPVLKSTYEQSAKIVSDMERKNPELKSASEIVSKYWDRVMNEYVVGQFLSASDYAKLKQLYPDYAPTYRIFSTLIDKFGGVLGVKPSSSKRSASVGMPIKEAVGSVEDIIPLADQYAMLLNKYVRTSRKNDAVLNLYDSVAKNPGAYADQARVADPVNVGIKDETFDEVVDAFDEIGAKEVKKGIYVLNGYRDGKKLSVQVNGRIFREYKDLLDIHDDKDMLVNAVRGVTNLGRAMTNPFKSLVTGHNPLFATRNITRDIPTRIIQSIETNPLELGKGLGEAAQKIATNHPDYQKFRATGAHMAGFYDVEKGFEKSFAQRNQLNDILLNPIHKAWNKLGEFNETTEQLNRFAEYLHGIKKYGDTPEGRLKAMSDAAEVTTNFSRTGYVTQVLNAWIPYLNSAVQGIRKSGSTLMNRPIQTALKGVAVITVPAMILDQVNKDNPYYEQLDNRTKDTYFLIPIMDSAEEDGYPQRFIKIPKAREYGVIFANLFERMRRGIDNEEEAFKGIGKTIATNFLPPTQDILKPAREALLRGDEGKDFAGRPIIPFALRGLEPYAQFDERTSQIGIRLGEATKNLPENMQISPKKADYLISNYGSWIGQALLGAANQNAGDLDRIANAIGIPTKRSFEADPLFSNQTVSDFYELLGESEKRAKTSNAVLGTPSAEKTVWEEKVSAMNNISDAMSQISKAKNMLKADKTLTTSEAEKEIRKLQAEYVKLAEEGVKIGRTEITPGTPIESIEALTETSKQLKNDNYKVLIDFGTISMDSLVSTPQQLEKFNYMKKNGLTDAEALQGFAAIKGLTKKGEKFQAIQNLNMSADKKNKLIITLVAGKSE